MLWDADHNANSSPRWHCDKRCAKKKRLWQLPQYSSHVYAHSSIRSNESPTDKLPDPSGKCDLRAQNQPDQMVMYAQILRPCSNATCRCTLKASCSQMDACKAFLPCRESMHLFPPHIPGAMKSKSKSKKLTFSTVAWHGSNTSGPRRGRYKFRRPSRESDYMHQCHLKIAEPALIPQGERQRMRGNQVCYQTSALRQMQRLKPKIKPLETSCLELEPHSEAVSATACKAVCHALLQQHVIRVVCTCNAATL